MDVTRDFAGGFGVAARTARNDYGHGIFSLPYSSLMYSAGILRRHGYEIHYIDAQAERLDAPATIARVRRAEPDVVISVMNLPSIYDDARLLGLIKDECRDARTVNIGTVCRVLPNEVASAGAGDVIILGEPELVLPCLVKAMMNDVDIGGVQGIAIVQDGLVTVSNASTALVNVQELPWPPHDVMPTTLYRDGYFGPRTRFFPIWASRGCPMPCAFYCPYPVGMGRKIRYRPSVDVVNEMEHLNHNYGVTAFLFRDQLFSSRPEKAEEICDLITERRMRIRWICETRFNLVTERLLKKMKKAGCERIHFGLETGDPHLLETVGKPGLRMQTVRNAVRMTKQAGIKPLTHIILGLPGETPTTVRATLATLRELGIVDVSVNLATPYPGTPLFNHAKNHGFLETEDWSKYTSFSPVMRSERMSISELEASRALILENLFGGTPFEKVRYLCKNRQIVEFLSDKVVSARDDPVSFLRFLQSFLVRRDSS
jgi:radical SAM superfamily enzyme YgiQ (UPF0313 family)